MTDLSLASTSDLPLPVNDLAFINIADCLRSNGYIVARDVLPAELLNLLHQQVRTLDEGYFKRAGIGRDNDFHINQQVRSDKILWLDEGARGLEEYFAYMEAMRLYLNRQLLLGLFDYECHYAYYPKGGFYKRHVDAFRGQSNRRLSTVLYLNPEWQSEDGGELVLYNEPGDQELLRVTPNFGSMVIFLSDEFPHEVLPTRRGRYSLTGWFRVNGNDGINLDVPR
jgi:SM-20-related protein